MSEIKKNLLIIFITIASAAIYFLLVFNYFIYDVDVSYNKKYYTELTERVEVLPKINELGDYKDIHFKYYYKRVLFWLSKAYTLRVAYDDVNYEEVKKEILDRYEFQTEKFVDYDNNEKEPQVTIDSYNFNFLSLKEYKLQAYPKELIFVGFSDEKKEIAYVYFYDFDLDRLDESFEEFLRNECGWK